MFPGGKLDPSDHDPRCAHGATPLRHAPPGTGDDDASRLLALAVAACRECFEEAGLFFHRGAPLSEAVRRDLRAELTRGTTFPAMLEEHSLSLDLEQLVPFARWVTPVNEKRRFDTMFYLAAAPPGQDAVHDAHETTSAFWATPDEIISRFLAGKCAIFPPTHRSLEVLAEAANVADALARAARTPVLTIAPELVEQRDGETLTMALVLPGDPEHSLAEVRAPGRSRYVLRGTQWLPESAPHKP